MSYLKLIEDLESLENELRAEVMEGFEHSELETISESLKLIKSLTMDGEIKRTIAIKVLDVIEEMLEEKNITIPDEDREGENEEARLYGSTYYALEDKIVDILGEFIEDESDTD